MLDGIVSGVMGFDCTLNRPVYPKSFPQVRLAALTSIRKHCSWSSCHSQISAMPEKKSGKGNAIGPSYKRCASERDCYRTLCLADTHLCQASELPTIWELTLGKVPQARL